MALGVRQSLRNVSLLIAGQGCRSEASFDSEAVNFRAASELFAPFRKLAAGDMESLHLATRHQRRLVPTNGGTLLFGAERKTIFPDAWIQVGRFAGTTRTRILDAREIHDYPAAAIPLALEEVETA